MDQYSTEFAQAYVPARRKRRRMLVAMLLASSLATVGAGAMSLAVFTDSKASVGNWTTGTIILGVSPSPVFSATGIMPGDTGAATITVTNTGTDQLRYSVTPTVDTTVDTKGLADVMQMTISTGTKSGNTCTGGTTLYSGKLSAAGFGSASPTVGTGDRPVAPLTGTDSLCFAWSFPLAADKTYMGVSSKVTFTFDAEQTKNN